MRSNLKSYIVFAVCSAVMIGLYFYAEKNWLPKPEPQPQVETPTPEALSSLVGAAGAEAKALALAKPQPKPELPKPVEPPKPVDPPTLIELGGDGFFNKVLLTTQGGGVQQVILPEFNEADRLGKERQGADGQPLKLALIPGNVRFRPFYLRDDTPYPDLQPGVANRAEVLAEPSYTMFHYASTDSEDHWPLADLGTKPWRVIAQTRTEEVHSVTFETELPSHHLTITKTYTLKPKDYHIGLKIEMKKTGGAKGDAKFRYQLSGAHGLPIEGEWYTPTYRNALIGWREGNTIRRSFEDSSTIATKRGGDAWANGGRSFLYAAIATQYFASAICIDRTDAKTDPDKWWAYVRATTEAPTKAQVDEAIEQAKKFPERFDLQQRADQFQRAANLKQPQFDDITVRAVAEPLDLAPGETVTHTYFLYNGPAKVELLNLLRGSKAVDDALTEKYLNELGLKTITDYQSPSFLGRFANAIYWTDIVIFFTNLMHYLLSYVHLVFATIGMPGTGWGLSIIVLTVMVRLLLFFPSRKQTQMNMKMVEVQNRLKPEFEKLHEKYKDDFQTYNREKTALLLKNGVNPFAAMGGCLLLFAQMPVFMGLYFCLQESIFFRLEPFMWFTNLAAPDMTVWWSEKIPVISTPDSLGGFLYLGPYFNILPIFAVGLMMWQQSKMMPPATDEMAQQQRMMMKIMLGMMALFFYKVAAGLCIYFIATTIWGIIERQVIPKPKIGPVDHGDGGGGGGGGPEVPPKPRGWLGRKREEIRKKLEELQKQAEAQSSRQLRNDRGGFRRDNDRKKKKKR